MNPHTARLLHPAPLRTTAGPALLKAFDQHSLLLWRGETALGPADELALMKLLPYDPTAPPEQMYGPLGIEGVDRERYLRCVRACVRACVRLFFLSVCVRPLHGSSPSFSCSLPRGSSRHG